MNIESKVLFSYKDVHQLEYPINVARNVARETANTYFIFSSDIELYPSPGVEKVRNILTITTQKQTLTD